MFLVRYNIFIVSFLFCHIIRTLLLRGILKNSRFRAEGAWLLQLLDPWGEGRGEVFKSTGELNRWMVLN